jgi:hypothetical protein
MTCIPLITLTILVPIESFIGKLLRNGALHEPLGKVAHNVAANAGEPSFWDIFALSAISASNLVLFLLFYLYFSSLIAVNITIGAHAKSHCNILLGISLSLAFGLPLAALFIGHELMLLMVGGGILVAGAVVMFTVVGFSFRLMEGRNV